MGKNPTIVALNVSLLCRIAAISTPLGAGRTKENEENQTKYDCDGPKCVKVPGKKTTKNVMLKSFYPLNGILANTHLCQRTIRGGKLHTTRNEHFVEVKKKHREKNRNLGSGERSGWGIGIEWAAQQIRKRQKWCCRLKY